MYASESVAVCAARGLSGSFDRISGDAEPMQKHPGEASRYEDGERHEKRAGEIKENFASAQRCGYPGKRHIQGAGHASDYAQSGRGAP